MTNGGERTARFGQEVGGLAGPEDVRPAGREDRVSIVARAREAFRLALEGVRENPARLRSTLIWSGISLVPGAVVIGLVGLRVSADPVLPALALWLPWALLCSAAAILSVRYVRSPSGEPYDRFHVPNGLTLVRLVSAPLTLVPMWDVPAGSRAALAMAGVLGLMLASDSLDGVLARARGHKSDLGRMMDPLADVVLFGFLSGGLYRAGALPAWVLVLLLIRYPGALLGVAALTALRGRGRIKSTTVGKAVTAASAVLLVAAGAVALLRPSWPPMSTVRLALTALALPLAVNIGYLVYRAVRWPR